MANPTLSRAGMPLATVAATLSLGYWLDGVGVPLGWMLGAMLASGAMAAVMGAPFPLPPALQRAGLVVLSTSTGLTVTAAAVEALWQWIPTILATIVVLVMISTLAAMPYAKAAGVDRPTAFFSLLPGGVVEMANLGQRYDANQSVISALHALRVGMIVLMLPATAALFSHAEASSSIGSAASMLGPGPLLIALCIGSLGGAIGHLLKLPAAWLLGALIAVAGVSSTGLIATGSVPSIWIVAAQWLIGLSLGLRFTRQTITALPRALIVGIPVQCALVFASALVALILSRLFDASPTTLILSTAGGGMAEMTLAGKLLGANVALIAGFHTLRAVAVNLLAIPIWKWISQQPAAT
ncbi:AbrB family transcriptional regulator [Halomonas faecis]|uniref:AbrB family transcriptional regulator n=1 Tax=Halomonas faecis TaxID=1562110 RepID=UPI0013D2CADF|nr:AbrB family transcriptional regulator [Halomonas faecis]